MTLFTIGYGKWPAPTRGTKFVAALKTAGVELLVDIRHSPCSSSLDPSDRYGPKEMNLQVGDAGIVPLLRAGGVRYLLVSELGNVQKNDPRMAVFREHLSGGETSDWPVARGLRLVKELVLSGNSIALMCACAKFDVCHRKAVAEALLKLLPPKTEHRDLSK